MRIHLSAVLAMLACGSLAATYAIGTYAIGTRRAAAAEVARPAAAPPSAAQFARDFVSLTTKYATDHGIATRIDDAHCVAASAGHYMCSYAEVKPDGSRVCHVMQARWTPRLASSFTVTLAGRTGRCGSLREALDSLR